MVDSQLTYESHINHIKGNISRGIGILYKAKKYLNDSALFTMYYAFIYPYYTYYITVWGNTFSSDLEPLIKLQKRAVRQITGAGTYDHTMPIFQSLNVLNIPKLYIYSVLIFLYKYHHQDLPNFFCRLLYDEWYISWTWYQTKKTILTSIGSFQSEVKSNEIHWGKNQ